MLIGIPPFYDKNRNKMFFNIEQAPIRWPDKEKHGICASPEAQDLILMVRKFKFKVNTLNHKISLFYLFEFFYSFCKETERSAWVNKVTQKRY